MTKVSRFRRIHRYFTLQERVSLTEFQRVEVQKQKVICHMDRVSLYLKRSVELPAEAVSSFCAKSHAQTTARLECEYRQAAEALGRLQCASAAAADEAYRQRGSAKAVLHLMTNALNKSADTERVRRQAEINCLACGWRDRQWGKQNVR